MNAQEEGAEASAVVSRLALSILAGHALGAGVRWGIADFIADGTKTSQEVAEHCRARPDAMRRLLRAWAAFGLLSESEMDRFVLTSAGQLLRTDRERSAAAVARLFTDPVITDAWRHLDDGIRTGRPVFDRVFGSDFFSYIEQQPDVSDMFHAAMGQGTGRVAAEVARRYDASRFGHAIDIGGGDGTLLAALLGENPGMRGTVFDASNGAVSASKVLRHNDFADRSAVVTGDFLQAVPTGGDLYLMKSVLHDWDDDRCEVILSRVRDAIDDDGRLLIIEPILPDVVDGTVPPFTYLGDLNMLVNIGGRERTRADFEELCRRGRFVVADVSGGYPLGFSLIEAVPV